MEKTKTNTTEAMVELKPYERKHIENVKLLKDFVKDKSNLETFVNVLSEFETSNTKQEDTIGMIDISVGEKCKDGFITYLHIHTNCPSVAFGNWNNTEPTICIKDKNYRSNNILCSINLALMKNLKINLKKGYKCCIYNVVFEYTNIDYEITIKIDN